MSGPEPTTYDAATIPRCYRHPERETHISCQRCGRPICPDCMRDAAVGFQCPDCVREAAAHSREPRTAFGGRLTGGSSTVTMILIGLNVAVFVLVQASGGLVGDLGRRLLLLPDSRGYDPRLLEGVAQGAYWQLLTSTFLHTRVLHLAMNMIGLWLFGSYLESALGRWRFVSLYLLSGLAGSVAVLWLAPPGSVSLGASGSVFGLFGAALVVLLKQRRDVTQLLVLLGLNAVLSFAVRNVSWQAHLGGLIAGLLLGGAFAYAPRRTRTPVHVAALGAVLVVCLGLTVLRIAALTA